MKKKNKKEIRSINSNENLYNDFQLEQLEERLEMGSWLCVADCSGNCAVNCDVNCTVDNLCVVDSIGSCEVNNIIEPV